MPKPTRYLKQLEDELIALGDDAMLLEELDGFIAGLLICPELIKPSEWLPVVWGSEGEDEPAFDSRDHPNRVLGLVMEHYNDVPRTLIERPDRYDPLFVVDKRRNEILWEIWVAGFEKAVKLRPAAWQKLLTADHETAQAMSGLLTLADVDRRDSRFTPEQLDALTAAAPHQLACRLCLPAGAYPKFHLELTSRNLRKRGLRRRITDLTARQRIRRVVPSSSRPS
jgi:uncharacterized protein